MRVAVLVSVSGLLLLAGCGLLAAASSPRVDDARAVLLASWAAVVCMAACGFALGALL